MADLSSRCTFFNFRSPSSTNYYFLLRNSNYFSTTSSSFPAHSFTSTFRTKPLLCKPAIDVISTHEHSDGSLVFRFGDPTQVMIQIEQESSVVQDLDDVMSDNSLNVDLEKSLNVENKGVIVEDPENDADMVDKAQGEVNGSSLSDVRNESDPVELENPVTLEEEPQGVIESSAVEDLDGDSENEVMVNYMNGPRLTQLSDEFDPVELKKPVIVGEGIEKKGASVEVLDNNCENEVMVKKAETQVNGSGLTEMAGECDSVELEVPVTVDEEIENDGMGQSIVDKVLHGDHESVGSFKEAERDVNVSSLTELSVEFNLDGIVEGRDESSGSVEDFPVPVLNVAVEVLSSPEPNIQNTGYDQKVLIEDLSVENVAVAVAVEISEIENTTATEESSEINIGNSTSLKPVSFEPENNIYQSSAGTAVTIDDLVEVDAEVAENSTDVSVDYVEAESQDEVSEDGIEIYSGEVLSNSSNLQLDVSLSEDAKCEISQVSVQTVVVVKEGEIYANDIAAESPQLEAYVTDAKAQTSEMGNGNKNETVIDESESDEMQFTSVSPQLEAELQYEISEVGREIVSSALLSNLPDPQVDVSLSEVAECQISEVPLQSVVTGNGKEIDTIDLVSSSTKLEADINLSIRTETRTSENEIVYDESESGVIQFKPISPQLEAESQLDKEMGDGIVEERKEDEVTGNDGSDGDMIQLTPAPAQEKVQSNLHAETGSDSLEALQNDERVESPAMKNVVPRDLVLETERIKGENNLQISQLPVAFVNEVVEPESTESARKSEEIAMDFVLSSGAALLPHPSKVLTGGEDAYFITGQSWLGVADGVLQWSLDGSNSGVYAQDLIRNCEKLASNCKCNSISYPLDLLSCSVAETLSSGCSTILLARFDGQVLRVANVGDSGFIILRHGTVYKRSLPMLHAFHLPLQIEKDDDPSLLAELYQVDLEEDDVIVTATDGLFDNLYDQEISSIVFKSLATHLKLEEIAELLATKAQEVGGSTCCRSPFADSAHAAGYVGYSGGKLDDVTVIVSVVQRLSTSLRL